MRIFQIISRVKENLDKSAKLCINTARYRLFHLIFAHEVFRSPFRVTLGVIVWTPVIDKINKRLFSLRCLPPIKYLSLFTSPERVLSKIEN